MGLVSTSASETSGSGGVRSESVRTADSSDSDRLLALINPLSFRMSLRDRAERSIQRVRAHGGLAIEASRLEEIEHALSAAYRDPAPKRISRLVVAGGDGTLQAAVSWLSRNLSPQHFPDLIVLSAGRTNYVAADVGTRKHFLETLERILSRPVDARHPVQRYTLRLEHPDFGQQVGFFAAAGLIDYAIRDIHQWRAKRPGWWRNHHGATAAGLVRLGYRWLTGQSSYRPSELAIDAGELGRMDGPCKLLMMTTLELSESIARPYARHGSGDIRMTAVHAGARAFKRSFPRLLRGRFKHWMNIENGYLSGNCDNILINNINQITLDGQEFDLNPEMPLRVTPGPIFRFLRP